MSRLFTSLAVVAALGAAAPLLAAAPAQKEASIPFANRGGIHNWRVVDRDTLLIEGTHRRWYRAELMSPAHDLPFAQAIGFDTRPNGTLDCFSAVIVRGQRYPITSLVEVPAPAKNSKKPKA